MADILGRKLAAYGGSLSVDDVLLTFPGLQNQAAFIPYVVTSLDINYGQQVSRFYGLNLNKVFLVAGRAQGTATMQQILAAQGNLKTFYETYGNVCRADSNVLQFSVGTGCLQASGSGTQNPSSAGSVQHLTLGMCVVNTLGFGLTSENPAVNNTVQLSFESMEYN